MKLTIRTQKGFNLTELMIGITVGMLIVLAATAFYVTSVRSSAETIRMTKLTNETRAIMNLMVRDVRRAGYWSDAQPGDADMPIPVNPFSVRAPGTSDHTDLSIYESGECLLYSYDATYRPGPAGDPNTPGEIHRVDIMGFALDGTDLRMNNGSLDDTSDCDTTGWERLNDPATVAITALQFSTDSSKCRNVTEGVSWNIPLDKQNPADQTIPACECTDTSICEDYVAPNSGDLLVEVRQVRIQLEAVHLSDPNTTITLDEQVKVRNNRLFYAP